jgi:hypothetical protein
VKIGFKKEEEREGVKKIFNQTGDLQKPLKLEIIRVL